MINVLEWPGNSPDLNFIANLRATVKATLRKMDCSTMQKLIAAVNMVWYLDDELNKMCHIRPMLVDSIQDLDKLVIKARGGHNDY